MKISVGVATYNGEMFIHHQLHSIINQTVKPDEIVLIDDCSHDKTLQIASNILKLSGIDLIIQCNKENLGYYRNFEKVLERCTGDIIFLSDQDDVWFPNKIEMHLGIYKKNIDALMVTNDCLITDSDLYSYGRTKLMNINSFLGSSNSMIMGCCSSISVKLLKASLPFPKEFLGHDNWLNAIASNLKGTILIKDILQFYRQYGSNTSSYYTNTPTKPTIFNICKVLSKRLIRRLYSYSSKERALKETIKELIISRSQKITDGAN